MLYFYNPNTNESIGITVSQGYRVRLSLKNEMRQNKDGIEIQLYLAMRTKLIHFPHALVMLPLSVYQTPSEELICTIYYQHIKSKIAYILLQNSSRGLDTGLCQLVYSWFLCNSQIVSVVRHELLLKCICRLGAFRVVWPQVISMFCVKHRMTGCFHRTGQDVND